MHFFLTSATSWRRSSLILFQVKIIGVGCGRINIVNRMQEI